MTPGYSRVLLKNVGRNNLYINDFFRVLLGLWLKRHQVGKSSSLKAKIKEAETDLDVTSIMLAREQAKYQVYDHSPFKDRLKVKKIKF